MESEDAETTKLLAFMRFARNDTSPEQCAVDDTGVSALVNADLGCGRAIPVELCLGAKK